MFILHVYLCMYVCRCVCVHGCMCICVYISVCVCVYMRVCLFVLLIDGPGNMHLLQEQRSNIPGVTYRLTE